MKTGLRNLFGAAAWLPGGAALLLAAGGCGPAPAASGGAATPADPATTTEAPATTPEASAGCLLDSFLALVGPDRHFQCGPGAFLYTIQASDPAACSATGEVYMGPAMQSDPMAIDLRTGSAAIRSGSVPAEADPEPLVVDGGAFSLGGSPCTALTEEAFGREYDAQERTPTLPDDEPE